MSVSQKACRMFGGLLLVDGCSTWDRCDCPRVPAVRSESCPTCEGRGWADGSLDECPTCGLRRSQVAT